MDRKRNRNGESSNTDNKLLKMRHRELEWKLYLKGDPL